MPKHLLRLALALLALVATLAVMSCGGRGGGGGAKRDITVTLAPKTARVTPGGTCDLTCSVTGTTDQRVQWTTSAGTISEGGHFIAPMVEGKVTVTATSVADPKSKATSTITVSTQTVGVTIDPPSATVAPGSTIRFTASVLGTSNRKVTWTTTGGTITEEGVFKAPSETGQVTVMASSVDDPSAKAVALFNVSDSQVRLSLTPPAATLQVGGQATFVANVTGTTEKRVTWKASGGTINTVGLFTAPTNTGSVTVTATSVADPNVSATATVTVTSTSGVVVSVVPPAVTLNPNSQTKFQAQVTGTANTAVVWSTTAGTIDTEGNFTAPPSDGVVTITATSAADPTAKGTAVCTVTSSKVTVTISPQLPYVAVGSQTQFYATVSGNSDRRVNWSVSAGSITPDGLYTAPGTTTQSIVITATSSADSKAKGTLTLAALTSNQVTVSVSPATVALPHLGTTKFTASVDGTSDHVVSWTASAGTISYDGTFTAPAITGPVTIRATSHADNSVSATATVTVTDESSVKVTVDPQARTVLPSSSTTFTATVIGTSNTGVTWSTSAGSINQSGVFFAPTTQGSVTIRATSKADSTVFGIATIIVSADAKTVTISPTGASIGTNESKQFTATVAKTTDQRVIWTATGGTISSNGLYHAGEVPGTYQIVATSVADPTSQSSATIVVNPIKITIYYPERTMGIGTDIKLAVRISGPNNGGIVFSATGGTIKTNGRFVAPLTPGDVTVTVTSVADPNVSETMLIHVVPPANLLFDFEKEVGKGFTPARSGTTPRGQGFLGPFGTGENLEIKQYGLSLQPNVHVAFDLYVIGPWDGTSSESKLTVTFANYNKVIEKTFANLQGRTQSYPDGNSNPPGTGSLATNTLGYTFSPSILFADAIYHIEFDVPYKGGLNFLELSITSNLAATNPSAKWGIDNLRIVESR